MLNKLYAWYALACGRPFCIKFNKMLYNLSLRGLGVLNYKTDILSGETGWLKKYLKNIQSPFVVDVGANIGRYTEKVLHINKSSKVVAIEPHPVTFQKLKKNLKNVYTNVQIYNYAVGANKGEIELFDYKHNDGSSHASIYKDVLAKLHKTEVVFHKVHMVTLDEILEKVDCIDLLKIDTEGNELNVLLGAKKLIDSGKIQAIHFEFNEMNIISKTTFKDFWDLLSNQYDFFRLLPYGELLKITFYSPLNCEIYQYQNIICLKKSKL